MAHKSVRYSIDSRKINKISKEINYKSAEKAANIVVMNARDNLVKAGRYRTGALLLSLKAKTVLRANGRVAFLVGSDMPYAVFQEKGVGPFGPKRAKVLRFKPKGSGAYVFARYVKGFKGAFYFKKALAKVNIRDFGLK